MLSNHSLRPLLGALALLVASAAAAEPGYYRDPALHGDTVVFTAESDLWRVPVAGGLARRLTSHPGEESQSAISPDGRWIGFVGEYDGADEAYVIPLDGGEPRRLSFEGGRVLVQGWSPQGELVYASDQAVGPSWHRILRAVHPETLARRDLPLADANEAGFASDGTVYFTRFGLSMTTDNARGYRGGAMAQLWRFEPGAGREAQRLAADWEASLTRPLPWGERLVVLADAGGSYNLWSLDAQGGDRRQLTAHTDFEPRGASLQGDRIVYQHGADLRLFDLASGADAPIAIELASDFAQRRTRWLGKPLDYLTSAEFGLGGSQVALTARGRVALAGTGPKRRVELPLPPEARARSAVPSADGKHVFLISDASGEPEIWRYRADGSGDGEQLTRDGGVHRWNLYPSPDGTWLAHDDKRGRLWLLDLASGRNRQLDDALAAGGSEGYGAVVWSPDSRLLALVRPDSDRLLNQIVLLAVDGSQRQTLTSDRFESFAPAFSRDGAWLYFLSNRHFRADPSGPWGDRNLGPGFDLRTRVYALDLGGGQRFPFLPADELQPAKADDSKDKDRDAKPAPATLRWDGLAERLFEVPLAPGNWRALALDDKRLYLLDGGLGPEAKPELKTLAIANDAPKPETFMAEVRSFALSGDAKSLWLMKHTGNGAGDMYIVEAGAKAPGDLAKAQVRVGDWHLAIEPMREWRQMFGDAARLQRDFQFDARLRGVDWPAAQAKYATLLPRLTDRRELDDVLGQLSAELNVLHSQVRAGDLRADPERPAPAFLGAVFEPVDGGLRLARVLAGDPELPSERGPLARPGVDARAGDVLTAVNGRAVRSEADLALALMQQAGQQVLLDLRRGTRAHRSVAVPVDAATDASLRYGEWVRERRAAVERASGGRIGYLHLRAMGPNDIASFARDFYAQFEREGLIIDVRRNRGGNIDSWVIEKLLRRAWAFWQRPGGKPYWNMQQTFRGHLAVLIDPLTYSDGETFAAGIKSLGLAPLIGQRTAGAGVWLSDRTRLSDNGMARVAEFAQYGADGRWLIEGRGVSPDIEVENPPHASWNGSDAQLEAAIANVLQRMQREPVRQPAPQPIPSRERAASDVR